MHARKSLATPPNLPLSLARGSSSSSPTPGRPDNHNGPQNACRNYLKLMVAEFMKDGGIRTRRPLNPMPRSPHSRQENLDQRNRGLEQKNPNNHPPKVDWQFTTDDARINLKHLYPSI